MILTCPACAARYEVAAAALPEGGRAVECSACGHGWFWRPADPPPSTPAAVPGAPPPDDDSSREAPDHDSLPPRPPLEERLPAAVLAVLREEAAREIAARAADAAREGGASTQAGARAGAGAAVAGGNAGDSRASVPNGESPGLAARTPPAGHAGNEGRPDTEVAEAAGDGTPTEGAAAAGPSAQEPGDGRADAEGAVHDSAGAAPEGAEETAGPELPADPIPARNSGGDEVRRPDTLPPADAGAATALHAEKSGDKNEGRRRGAGARRALVIAILLIPVAAALLHAFAGGLAAHFPALAPMLEALLEGVAALRRAIGGEG